MCKILTLAYVCQKIVNRNYTIHISWLFALLLVCTQSLAGSLDVVLLMDSSGSMKNTDPGELRKSAAKLFISLLGDKDRASVVSFSDQGYPVAYLSPTKGDKNQQMLFKAVDKISHRGIYTNLSGALDTALRVIDRDPGKESQAIVILMSDGKMDLGNAEATTKQSSRLPALLSKLKQRKIQLHTIAFTDQSDKDSLNKMALSTGGKFNIAATDKQLHNAYTTIFEQNKQPNMLPFNGEKFTVDNAIKEVTVVASKENEKIQLTLISPSGKRLNANNVENNLKWFVAEAFDLITITKPEAGTWQLQSSEGKNKAYIITDLKMRLTAEPAELAIGEGLLIQAWMENNNKIITRENLLSNIKIDLSVATPEGQSHQLVLEPKPTGSKPDGKFISHIALPSAGKYELNLIATASTFSRERSTQVQVYDPNAVLSEPVPLQQAAVNTTVQTNQSSQKEAAIPRANTQNTQQELQLPPVPTVSAKPETATTQQNHKSQQAELVPKSKAPHKTGEKHSHSAEENHDHKSNKSEKQTSKSEDNKAKAKNKKPKKSKESKKSKDSKDSNAESGPTVLNAILIFLGFNIVFIGIGAGAYFFMKKRRGKSPEQDQEQKKEDMADAA